MEIGRAGIASIMFTDIVDSTALAEAMGDRAWSRVVEAHAAGVAARIEAAGGELVKSLGDGTLSSFPTAVGALAAAAAIQAASAEREPRLRVRIGIHTGDLVRAEDDYLGGVVNKAARIAAAAAPEEMRVSEVTRLMAGGAQGLRFEDPVQVALKGLEGEHLLHRLVAAAAR
ncbi:MAG: adenylate/guanylate cyclase domain-containing protein [Pseudomonadota bacterium]